MLSIDGIYEDLTVINKSKFYSFAYPVFCEEQVKEYLEKLNEKYSDATHICFAYSLSSPRLEKMDDDGEPTGTAGKPILELIKKRNLENVLVVVVRYFGGIKLGAGGLVRAYTGAGNVVLDRAKIVNFVDVEKFQLKANLSQGTKVLETLRAMGVDIRSCVYGEYVEIEFVGNVEDKMLKLFPNVELKKIGSERQCQRSQE